MTHYEELGLAPNATPEEIRHAHRTLARLLHPDHVQDEALRALAECQMKRLNAIYAVLMDPSRRRMYDLQTQPVMETGPGVVPPPPPIVERPGGFGASVMNRLTEWALWPGAPWLLALAALGVALASLESQNERVVYVERPVSGAPARAGQRESQAAAGRAAGSAEARQYAEEARELRRQLNQAVSERDQALQRLNARGMAGAPAPTAPLVSASAAALHPTPAQTAPASDSPAPALPSPPPLVATSAAAPANVAVSQQQPRSPRLGGTWIYAPHGNRHASGEQYPADYIELVLDERDGHVWGRYRARYRVTDRALSPDVEFFFEGEASSAAARYPWRGSGGSKGELQLRLISENTLSVGWFTSQLGRVPSLGSGSAVLVRRQDSSP